MLTITSDSIITITQIKATITITITITTEAITITITITIHFSHNSDDRKLNAIPLLNINLILQ